ncbi:MAG: hypothetical protein ACYS47_13600 [Planctomycetota bacterium]
MCLEKAIAFATSLDREDHAAAAGFLDENCVYYIGDRCMQGREEIVSAYRENAERARRVFDTVIYSHSVTQTDHREFLILFLDAIRHEGTPFVHKCKQKIVFNNAERIDLIIHHDIPGEREKLEAFMRERGIG